MSQAVLTLITDALIALGVVAEGDPATAGQAQLGLRTLNRLLGAYSTDRLLIYAITRTTFTLVSGQASYTVGSGGGINIARPAQMNGNGAHVTYLDTTQNLPTEIGLSMLTDDTYQAIVQKTYASAYPTAWYYNPTNPLGTLTVWPVPNVGTLTGVFYVPTAVSSSLAITDTLVLPPEWGRFLTMNLALELSIYFPGVRVSQELKDAAKESKGDVERTNTRLVDLSVDLALQPSQNAANFYTDAQG